MKQLIDIHSHIIPGVDDGSQSLEDSLDLLRQASEEGITDMIVTPHYMKEGVYRKKRADILPSFSLLKEEIEKEGISVTLHLGNEIYCTSHMDELLEDEKVSTLADSKYVLVEFNFDKYSSEYDDMLYDLAISGYQIIIAHPERYHFVQKDINQAYRWVKEGYLLQANQSSIMNEDAKVQFATVKSLVENNYISFVASDAHSHRRPITLIDAYERVSEWCDEEYADVLFYENPKRILNNEEIDIPEVEPFVEKKGFFSKLFGGKK